ncbi:hypothetical protein OE88DRAFT_1646914 [Heliocybe sulcata]|uniref:Uncharacterized protein n=1 Tax=Heliocybe sulcata TaxID=5364 RepID=A0A5C3MYH7_9AGAM|nr:hypothetical protein OE88DRAFT_1646914 [Heliocybe sulcata]
MWPVNDKRLHTSICRQKARLEPPSSSTTVAEAFSQRHATNIQGSEEGLRCLDKSLGRTNATPVQALDAARDHRKNASSEKKQSKVQSVVCGMYEEADGATSTAECIPPKRYQKASTSREYILPLSYGGPVQLQSKKGAVFSGILYMRRVFQMFTARIHERSKTTFGHNQGQAEGKSSIPRLDTSIQ